MNSVLNALAKFFGVAFRGQTYLNLLYLSLAFPLGLFYFVFLVTGLSLGIPLVIIWVGLVILVGVFAAWYGLIAFERQLAIGLLRVEIPPMEPRNLAGQSLWQMFKAALGNTVTWKGLVYLFLKFPIGLVSFVVLVTLIALSAGLVGMPFYYAWFQPQVGVVWNGTGWVIDTLGEALLMGLVGIFVALISLHCFNGLAWLSAKFAHVMLGSPVTVPAGLTPTELPSLPQAPVEAGELG